ncbi:Uma2 family endonuclease [Kitasatospora sp. NPDC101183]|uniref:Uma2 family endonuclease n=1 Tax=Kitasatospora sp. NPDC101183 TaxID=3364100 RepID=UPI0038212AC3
MSISPAEFSLLRSACDTLVDVPGVGRAEVARGQIFLTLPPDEHHEAAVRYMAEQLDTQLPHTHPGFVARPDAALEASSPGILRRPDLTVVARSSPPTTRPYEALLVVEVISKPNPESDYHDKLRDYSAMNIPLYLIVDPRTGTGIVHSEPGYTRRTDFVFGDTVTVGPWTLDTSVLRTYC